MRRAATRRDPQTADRQCPTGRTSSRRFSKASAKHRRVNRVLTDGTRAQKRRRSRYRCPIRDVGMRTGSTDRTSYPWTRFPTRWTSTHGATLQDPVPPAREEARSNAWVFAESHEHRNSSPRVHAVVGAPIPSATSNRDHCLSVERPPAPCRLEPAPEVLRVGVGGSLCRKPIPTHTPFARIYGCVLSMC
jgi:hypothetical protein